MDDMKLPLILASGSPRRKELLSTMGLTYTVDVSDVDEHTTGAPDQMVIELSGRKARAVAQRYDRALVLAVDHVHAFKITEFFSDHIVFHG